MPEPSSSEITYIGELVSVNVKFWHYFHQVTLEFALNEEASVNLSELRFHIPSSEQQVKYLLGVFSPGCCFFLAMLVALHLTSVCWWVGRVLN